MKYLAILLAITLAGVTAASAATLDQRVKKLENKTDYYRKTVRAVTKTGHRVTQRLALRPAATSTCQGIAAQANFAVGNTDPGLTNIWATANVTWTGILPSIGIGMRRQGGETPNSAPLPCREDFDVDPGGGTAVVKLFCQFTVQPQSTIIVAVIGNNVDPGCQFGTATISAKMVTQQMIEPED
jgi:hypothetical protein